MKLIEFGDSYDRNALWEMSQFYSDTTGLSNNMGLWVRTEPKKLRHSNYRIKIYKGGEHVGSFVVGKNPRSLGSTLSVKENNEVMEFISEFSSLIISLIDGKISSGGFENEVKRIRGS